MSSQSTAGLKLPPPALQSSKVVVHESGGRGGAGAGAGRTAAVGGINEASSLREEYQHNALPAGTTATTHLEADPAQASASARRRKPVASSTATPGSNGNHANGHNHANGSTNHKKRSSAPVSSVDRWKPRRDVRTRLPRWMRRWTGYRDPDAKPPYDCLPIPPFTWLAKLPLKYETWILSTVGSFVGIALIEVIISAAFPNDGTILIVASYGASAVLSFGTIESPLAQPRHLVGGQVLSCILAVCVTKLFRLSPHYQLSNTIVPGELNHLVWINGALSMALSILLMQMTGTVHPPGGATAIIASVQPAAVEMSWRLIYIVLISGLIMLVWACIINNVGRRRYPNYWLSGTTVFVKGPKGEQEPETVDQAEMALEEGRSPWLRNYSGEEIVDVTPMGLDAPNVPGSESMQGSNERPSEKGHPVKA